MLKKAARSVLVAAVTVGALAGCAQNPSVAAVVDGATITEAQVTQAAKALEVALNAPADQSRRAAADFLVKGAIARGLAADNGVAVTPAQVDAYIASQGQLTELAAQPGGKQLVEGVANLNAVTQALPTETIIAQLPKHTVVLNPRYGTWDAESGSFTGTGSLSTLVGPQR